MLGQRYALRDTVAQTGTYNLADVVTVIPYFRKDSASVSSAVSAATNLREHERIETKFNGLTKPFAFRTHIRESARGLGQGILDLAQFVSRGVGGNNVGGRQPIIGRIL